MVAFQAADPGSTPGQRTVLFFPSTLYLMLTIDYGGTRLNLTPFNAVELHQTIDGHGKLIVIVWIPLHDGPMKITSIEQG
jgi:hypothetical protein